MGATTRAGMLTNPLRDRFGIVQRLEFYSDKDLATIVSRSANILGLVIEDQGAYEIARRARGTPRIANRLLRRVRDYAEVRGKGQITKAVADMALNLLDVDERGFDHSDRRLLLTMIEKFDGGPVGWTTWPRPSVKNATPSRTCLSRTSSSKATSCVRRAAEWSPGTPTCTLA